MFSKSKSKGDKVKKRTSDSDRPRGNLTQFGLLDVPNVSDLAMNNDDDEDDAALEAELLALTGKGGKRSDNKKVKKIVAPEVLYQMVAECMKDEEDDDNSDYEDPDLLAELNALGYGDETEEDENVISQVDSDSQTQSDISPTDSEAVKSNLSNNSSRPIPSIIRPSPFLAGPSILAVLTERIAMYEEAIQNAIDCGEDARAKRFKRGLATLNQMLKSVKAGKAINEEDIPPSVLVKTSRANSKQDVSEPKIDSEMQENRNMFSDNGDKANISSIASTTNISSVADNIKISATEDESRITSTTTIPQNVVFDLSEKEQPTSTSANYSILIQRQMQYKVATLNAKKAGDMEIALQYLKIVKQLAPMIDAAQRGQEVDVISIPASPDLTIQGFKNGSAVQANKADAPISSVQKEVLVQHNDDVNPSESANTGADSSSIPSVQNVPAPASTLEALEQRLEKYTQQRDKAKAEEDSRKERMNMRIMKQYQDAIKGYKAGKAIAFDELPTPPGYPPIPTGVPQTAAVSPSPRIPPSASSSTIPATLSSGVAVSSPPSKEMDDSRLKSHRQAPPIPISANSFEVKPNVRKTPQSRVERQLSLLQKRQTQFKEAALESKKRGEIEQAKEYLRNFKGLDQLIMATNSGLPVDMNTVPVPPQEQVSSFSTSIDFEVIDKDDCTTTPLTTPADIAIAYSKLEDDLIAQIKMCAHTREHFKALGDVASSNRFENLIIHTKKDLDAIRVAMKRGDNPPRFHYETRSFTIIQCNTELNDSDCEVTIMRGINYNVPNAKEVDTYVKLEFPYPSEAPPQGRTEIVKGTNCPEYNHKVVFSIDRKARALSRVFKRHSVKCQVVARGGWFHRDSVIGTAKVPLVALETICTLHESFDLVDERKKMVGGKLEVKIRVRNPIISKQLEKVNEKWVVIDGF